jgi:hypothetical protein
MGSTPAARHAGSAEASNAASPNANVDDASMTGSQGLTLNNCCVISFPAPIAAGMPIANPMATCGNGGTDEKYPQRAILRCLMLRRSRVYVLPAARDTGND